MMFPFIVRPQGLTDRDFFLLEGQFSQTVLYFLPAKSVHFFPVEQICGTGSDAGEDHDTMSEIWTAGMRLVAKKKQPVVHSDGSLLFIPIYNNEAVVAFAVLLGDRSINYLRYEAEWLHERSRLISRELGNIKQWGVDSESGLLNGSYLRESVASLLQKIVRESDTGDEGSPESWSLFLVDIFLKTGDSGKSAAEIARAGACLNSFIGDVVPLSHFGSGLFGMLWNGDSDEEYKKLGYALMRKLKRQNFSKVHIGVVPVNGSEIKQGSPDFDAMADATIEKAWETLRDAKSRGPFAVCSSTGEMATSVFRDPAPSVTAELQKKWRGESIFSVIFLQADDCVHHGAQFSKRISSLLGEEALLLPENGCEAYLYLPGMNGKEAMSWVELLREHMDELGGITYSMGIASFPYCGFRKIDTPVNARKALVHTKFFGRNTATLFDGVSLNISGDVYYNEGDLAGAIKEYKRGLKVDPENINLLNSLAVVYAQINRYRNAMPLFEKVLSVDEQNFMALFNMGFACLRCDQREKAVQLFEKALAVDDSYFDLLLQLGQTYCETERFAEALQVLNKAESLIVSPVEQSDRSSHSVTVNSANGTGASMGNGLIFRYLAISCQELGKSKEAIVYFQKAVSYNARDAESLSRLGELYLVEGQGNDIALSLCQQAVNIDEANAMCWYRLAWVQFTLKSDENVMETLKQCLTLDRRNIHALLLMGTVYRKLGQKKRALQVYNRVLRFDAKNKNAKKALRKLVRK